MDSYQFGRNGFFTKEVQNIQFDFIRNKIMNDKNRINKIKRIIIKIIVFVTATILILTLYRILSKKYYNVSRKDVFSGSVESDEYKTDSEEYVSNVVDDDSENNLASSEPNDGLNYADESEDDFDEEDDKNENIASEEIENSETDTLPMPITTPNLIGVDEATAINICNQNGYKCSIEYYLGGNSTVISQKPTSSESIESGGNITINIGVSQSDFSNKLLALINEKRRAAGLGDLVFSEQLNMACSILAQENVNSVDCTRPDGSHWSSVLLENDIWLNEGVFTTRSNITSLSDANRRIKYAGNSYGEGNLLTPSFTMIGMAYSSNNMLVIIIGC